MSKRTSKLLSLILALIMVISLFPSTAYALGGGSGVGVGGDEWGRDIGEDEIQDFTDYDPEVQDVEEYDYFQALDLDTFAEVLVQAPLGALPTLAEVRLDAIPVEDMREAVDAVVDGKPEILVALDISFWLGNEEIEPAEPVRVKISAPVLEGKSGLQVIHFPDNNAQPETMQLIGQEDQSFPVGSNEIAFVAESFSTYAVTWSGGGECTVHFGYIQDDDFKPFSEDISLDSNASSMNLDVIVDGYIYSGAYYVPDADGDAAYDLDSSILTKVTDENNNTSWTALVHVPVAGGGNETTLETMTLATGSDIYVLYVKKAESYTPPGPSNPQEVKGPITEKQVTDNHNGTYKIRLDITGQMERDVNRIGANVIVIMDRTQSMSNEMSPGVTRMDAAKTAMYTLIDTLNPGSGESQHLINMTVVEFCNWHEYRNPLTWTQSRDAMENYVDNLVYQSGQDGLGTNWQIGLYGGRVLAQQATTNANYSGNKTYVIFVTDGNPNAWYTRPASDGGPTTTGNNNQRSRWNQEGNGYFVQDAYDAALPNAYNLAALCGYNLYGIYCGGPNDDGKGHLQALMNYNQGGNQVRGKFIDGTSEDAINEAFATIAQTIVNELGASEVTVDDGIPKLANVSSSVSGSAGGFQYYISYPMTLVEDANDPNNGKYRYTIGDDAFYVDPSALTNAPNREADGYEFSTGYCCAPDPENNNELIYYITMEWDDAPSAASSGSNGVTWNLSEQKVLADKTIYTLTFDVWPSQEAYDLLANLNNNMPGYTLDQLDDATREQLVVTLTNNGTDVNYQYTPGDEPNSGTWAPKSGSPSYTTAEFLQEIAAAGDDNVEYNILTNTHLFTTYKYKDSTYSDPPTGGMESGAMLLEDQTIKIVKYWHNDLDEEEAENIWLTITRDGVKYIDVHLDNLSQLGPGQWKQEPADEIFISCGVMTVETVNGQEVLTLKTTGHEYSVVENDGSPWYWDLTAYVFHPMVVQGKNTMLRQLTDEELAELPNTVTGMDNLTRVESGGVMYYKFNDKIYFDTKDTTNTLYADNDRRSSLEITKALTAVEGEQAPTDEMFTFAVNMVNPTIPYEGQTGYNSNNHTFWFVVLNDPASDPENPTPGTIVFESDEEDSLVVSGANAEKLELRLDDNTISNIQWNAADTNYPYDYFTYTDSSNVTHTVKAVDADPHNGEETRYNANNEPYTYTYQYYSYYTGYYWFDNVSGGTPVNITIKPEWRICFTSITRGTDYTITEPLDDMPSGFVYDSFDADATCVNGVDTPTAAIQDPDNARGVKGSIDCSNSKYFVEFTNKFIGFFYVYHSSDCSVERFGMSDKGVPYSQDKGFNIYELTAENTLYGGYYSNYAGKSDGFDADAAKALDYSGKDAPTDMGATAYSYQAIAGDTKNNIAPITWAWGEAYSVAGTAMIPEINTVYYLKEVPNGYELPYTHFTYYKDEALTLGTVWAITAVDDLNYSAAGFYVETANKPGVYLKSITIKTDRGSSSVELTAGKVFKSKGMLAGYLGYVEITDYMAANATVMIRQYWTTKDGINVFGVKMRSLSFGNCTYSGIGKTDSDYVPITTDH